MRTVKLDQASIETLLAELLKRSPDSYGQYEASVAEIIQNIRTRKDEALFAYTEQFDHVRLDADSIRVTEEEIEEAYEKVDPDLLEVIRKALVNIRAYHENINGRAGSPQTREGLCWGRRSFPCKKLVSMCREEKQFTLLLC